MSKKRIITDDVDLSNKTAMTDETFYGASGQRSSDSSAPSAVYKGKSRFFALLSTSDKAINYRLYDKESWKKTVTDGSWEGPVYAKPMIRNHDIRNQMPFGRIKDSFFVEHGSFETINKDSKKLEKKVLDFYKNKNLLADGTASVIVEFSADELTANRMIAGLDATVSQSSYFKDATCTVCGNDYFSGDCNHFAGRTYQIKKDDVSVEVECLVMTKDFEPIELSIVNTPANDTSVIFVLNDEDTPAGDNKDNKPEPIEPSKKTPGIDGKGNPCEDNDDDKTNQTEDKNKMFKEMLKDTLTANIKKDISEDEGLLNAFGALFDAANEDQVPLVKTLMDEIAKVVETVKLESADGEEGEVTPEPNTTPEPANTQDNKPATPEPNSTPEPGADQNEGKDGKEVETTKDGAEGKTVEEQIKDALGVVEKNKATKDNKVLNTIIKGLKL